MFMCIYVLNCLCFSVISFVTLSCLTNVSVFQINVKIKLYLILSCLVLSSLVIACLVLHCLVLSYIVLSYHILSYHTISYHILSYPILSYFITVYLILNFYLNKIDKLSKLQHHLLCDSK